LSPAGTDLARGLGLSLLDALGDEKALYATALLAGLRRGELRALRVSDVHRLEDDAVEGWISVERSWTTGTASRPKSKAGVRLTLLCETLRVILAEHVRQNGRSGGDLIFGKTATAPFVPWTVGRHAEDAWTTAKLEQVTSTNAATASTHSSMRPGSARPVQTATWVTRRTASAIATGIDSGASSPTMPSDSTSTSRTTSPTSSRS